jgi:hypothetical protein
MHTESISAPVSLCLPTFGLSLIQSTVVKRQTLSRGSKRIFPPHSSPLSRCSHYRKNIAHPFFVLRSGQKVKSLQRVRDNGAYAFSWYESWDMRWCSFLLRPYFTSLGSHIALYYIKLCDVSVSGTNEGALVIVPPHKHPPPRPMKSHLRRLWITTDGSISFFSSLHPVQTPHSSFCHRRTNASLWEEKA